MKMSVPTGFLKDEKHRIAEHTRTEIVRRDDFGSRVLVIMKGRHRTFGRVVTQQGWAQIAREMFREEGEV